MTKIVTMHTHGRRQPLLALAFLVVAVLAASTACGGDSGSEEVETPATEGAESGAVGDSEAVVRAFTAAVNAGENERAAELLADGAVIYGERVPAGGGEEAVAALHCVVEIESVERDGDTVTAELRATGTRESAAAKCEVGEDLGPTRYTVRDGKIAEIND